MKKIKTNFVYAFTAQFVSMCTSIVVSLLLPRILGVNQFAYWQLFVFLTTYTGLFHFGLSDGIYLRYGGKTRDEMPTDLLLPQLGIMTMWLSIISIIGTGLIFLFIHDFQRVFVWIIALLYMIVANAVWYLGYIFQAAGDTDKYSKSVLVSKLLFVILLLIFALVGEINVKRLTVSYLFSQGVALLYCVYNIRDLLAVKCARWRLCFTELGLNIKTGIVLTVSNVLSNLVYGIGRVVTDYKWGIEAFGLISLSLSLINLALQFMQQISIVLFPALRQVDNDQRRVFFEKYREYISWILCACLILVFPARVVLSWWIPKYTESLLYLDILAPIVVFDGKLFILYNTYLKVLRAERRLLLISILSCVLSLMLCIVGTMMFESPYFVMYILVVVSMVRSLLAEFSLYRIMNSKMRGDTLLTIFFAVLCICLHFFTTPMVSAIICLLFLAWWLHRLKYRQIH